MRFLFDSFRTIGYYAACAKWVNISRTVCVYLRSPVLQVFCLHRIKTNAVFFLVGLCLSNVAHSQWITQTITLRPGWNAVYLEVQPEPNDCDTIFDGIQVESIWDYSKEVATVQFVDNPTDLLPKQPDWLVWFPQNSPNRVARNLFVLIAGRSYMIKYAGTEDFQWQVRGIPRPESFPWVPDSFNLRGFPVSESAPPSFEAFFSASTAHAGQSIYRLNNATAAWELIDSPATDTMKRGESYWIFSRGPSEYEGPIVIDFDFGDGVDFADTLSEYELRLKNISADEKELSIRVLNSEAPPTSAETPLLAGGVPLDYFNIDFQDLDNFGFISLPDPLVCPVTAAGNKLLTFQVRRQDMTLFSVPDGKDALYQSILQISDGSGFVRYLPVTAEGFTTTSPVSNARSLVKNGIAQTGNLMVRKGLWVGTVVVDAVSEPENQGDSTTPTPVGAEYQFRVIIHQDANGNFKFLQQVYLLFKEGTLKEDPPNSGIMVVDQPGEFVLVTDDSLIDKFGGSTIRDTDTVGRRISTVNFGFDTPIAMSSATASGAFSVSCTIPMDYRHRLNPFVHKFHPDHNNLDERYETALEEGVESYSFARELEFEFSEIDPEDLSIAGYGDTVLGGTFRETVTGIHRQPIHSSGLFRLTHVSSVPILNGGIE